MQPSGSAVHHAILTTIVRRGSAPTAAELAAGFVVPEQLGRRALPPDRAPDAGGPVRTCHAGAGDLETKVLL